MNFLEICQRVFDEGDRAPYAITTTSYSRDEDEQIFKIVNWVKQAYKEIQLWSRFFNFHQVIDKVFITTSSTSGVDYNKSNVRRLRRTSIRARKVGETAYWDMTYLTYQQWNDQLRNANLGSGPPVWFIELPTGKFRILPEPDDAYEILADWTMGLDELEKDKDEPLWDEDLHDIVVWVALKYYMNEYETPEELAERVKMGLRFSKAEFLMRYLPDIEGPGSWI